MKKSADLSPKVLFISNGHGEDLNSSLIAQSVRQLCPNLKIDAFPIVGAGKSYSNKQFTIVAPLQPMPSGGIFYLNPLNFLKDIFSGLIGLTLKQFQKISQIKNNYDFVVAVGDVVPLVFAYLTGKNYVSFIVSTSSYYEGTLKLPWLTKILLRSSRCQQIFTRDQYTADDLQKQGFPQAIFSGYPIMDTLEYDEVKLSLTSKIPMIALLCGSRLPEALRNLQLQLKVVEKLIATSQQQWQFYAALVPNITEDDLRQIGSDSGWQYQDGRLSKTIANQIIEVHTTNKAFAEIVTKANIVLGMAGTAVEQAVGLGKPVIQTPSQGPQFTYRFAEAQMRLLGLNVITIDDHNNVDFICQQAVEQIEEIIKDQPFLNRCIANGKTRVGDKGGSQGIAKQIIKFIETASIEESGRT